MSVDETAVERLRVALASDKKAWTTTAKPASGSADYGTTAYNAGDTTRAVIGPGFRRTSSRQGIRRVKPYLQLRRKRTGPGTAGGVLPATSGGGGGVRAQFEDMADAMERQGRLKEEVTPPREGQLGDVLRGETYQTEGGTPGRAERLAESMRGVGASGSDIQKLEKAIQDPEAVDAALEGLSPMARKKLQINAAQADFIQRLRAEGVAGPEAKRRAQDYGDVVGKQTGSLMKERVRSELYELGVPASVATRLLGMNYYEASQFARKIPDRDLQKRIITLLQKALLMS